MAPYPFPVIESGAIGDNGDIDINDLTLVLQHCRGSIPSIQASRLRSMILDSAGNPDKILATPCSDDALTAQFVEEAGFPFIFLGGFMVSSTFGLPDTGYIAFQEMATRIQEVYRQVNIPILVDGDTGYGSPVSVRRTVQGFAKAGAAGVMIEDQTWPKRCGHTKGKAVVSREEAFARVRAAVDARKEGVDIVILARTDSLILGWDEAIFRASRFAEIGADIVFIEALPDRASMERAVTTLKVPLMANIIEGGLTENISARDLASLGYSLAVYPFTVAAAKINAIKQSLDALKGSFTSGAPPQILSAAEVCDAVGFQKYWDLEERYKY
ncbi:carboxyvinyl-carboxyphosphonate phosphorylmutase [Xylogone sp. PMI_703]|nr:carboxyvinyl-carboxyphosphonate phosphorylmutase [Xylogone sp. PMI_703]